MSCRRASSARASTTISATPSASSTASPPTASPIASCATMSRPPARACSRYLTFEDRDSGRAGREDLHRVLDPGAGRPRPRPGGADRGAAGAERDRPAGVMQTGDENFSVRVSGAFDSEQDPGCQLRRWRPDHPAARHRAVRRAYSDPPQPMFRVNGKPAIGLAISMRDGGDVLALGRNIEKASRNHCRLPGRYRIDAGRRSAGRGRAMPSTNSWNRSGRRSRSSWRSAS